MKKASKTVTDKRVGKKVAKTKAQIPPKTKPPPPPNKKQPAPIIRK